MRGWIEKIKKKIGLLWWLLYGIWAMMSICGQALKWSSTKKISNIWITLHFMMWVSCDLYFFFSKNLLFGNSPFLFYSCNPFWLDFLLFPWHRLHLNFQILTIPQSVRVLLLRHETLKWERESKKFNSTKWSMTFNIIYTCMVCKCLDFFVLIHMMYIYDVYILFCHIYSVFAWL